MKMPNNLFVKNKASASKICEEKNNPIPLLDIRDLSVSFERYAGGLRKRNLTVITSLSVSVRPGEILAIAGSSGSGKSLLAHAILGILPVNARLTGTMIYDNEDLSLKRQMALRGREIALVPQSVNFLDPLMRVGAQVREAANRNDAALAQRRVFDRYRLESSVEKLFPFQLSGGMARRVLVAAATISNARLIIADEPTPGLHPAVVRETLGHLRELADEDRAVMLITHDIEAALTVADRIAIFYAGATVETAPAADFKDKGEALRHPYSKVLWGALVKNGFVATSGSQPPPDALPPGCLFEPRCRTATSQCVVARPKARELRGGTVRCIHAS